MYPLFPFSIVCWGERAMMQQHTGVKQFSVSFFFKSKVKNQGVKIHSRGKELTGKISKPRKKQMKVKANGITQTWTIKKTTQNGSKGQEGWAGTQQDTGDTHTGSYLMWEKDEEVKIMTIQANRLLKKKKNRKWTKHPSRFKHWHGLIWWCGSVLEAVYACAWIGKGTEEARNKPQRRETSEVQCEQKLY